MGRSEQVDQWFERYDNPMKEVVQRIRAIVLGADARIDECIKWQAPTFTYRGNLASFYPKSKQHASLMFHVGARIPGKHPRLEGSGGTSRVVKIGSVAEANAAKRDIERIVRAWCDWREAPAGPRKPRAAAPKKTATTFDQGLADRLRRAIGPRPEVSERKMFGGLAFLLDGKMFCGVIKDDLMFRVGPQRYPVALREPHVRPMDFTGKPMEGYIYLALAGSRTEKAIKKWVDQAAAFVATVERAPAKRRAR